MSNNCNFGTNSKKGQHPLMNAFFEILENTNAFVNNDINTKADQKSPKMNVIEADEFYYIQFMMPGVQNKDDIKVSFDDKVLTVSHIDYVNYEESSYLRREFGNSSYERKVRVKPNLDLESMEASYENGILTLKVPQKAEVEKQVKEVSVQ